MRGLFAPFGDEITRKMSVQPSSTRSTSTRRPIEIASKFSHRSRCQPGANGPINVVAIRDARPLIRRPRGFDGFGPPRDIEVPGMST